MTRLVEAVTDEEEVPPAVTCPFCGRSECAGCEPSTLSPAAYRLAWESRRGGWLERLFRTALSTSTQPEETFGELADGTLGAAVAFASIAEAFAIGSLAVTAVLSLLVIDPDLALRVMAEPQIWGLLLALVAGGVLLMLALHALWGLCLELGARTSEGGARFRLGIRFGLYACGWDLLTSPAGVLYGLAVRGPLQAWRPIVRAVQAPSVAMHAYLERCRRFDGAAQRRAKRLTLVVIGATFSGIATALVAVFLSLVWRT